MKALLLAAGLGTRLRQLTTIIPKCLLPINGRPLLEYWLKYLSETGVTPTLVNLHYLPNVVEEYLIQSPFASQISTVHEETLLGTGGTLLHNREFFREEPTMLIHADNLCSCDFRAFVSSHNERPTGTEITMMTFTTPTPKTCGIVELDARDVVKAFHEKVENPSGNLANAAVYVLQPSVFEFLASLEKSVIDFSTEVLPHYLGRIHTYHNAIYHRDIGNIESLIKAQIEFPQAAEIPRGTDSWNSYCGEGNRSRAQNIMAALSKALGTSLWPLIPEQTCRMLERSQLPTIHSEKVMLVSDEVPLDLKARIKKAKKNLPESAQLFLLFHTVPPGFSSQKIFETLGVISFAVCACDITSKTQWSAPQEAAGNLNPTDLALSFK